ncbi:hypothetical protein COO60DRAFT_1041526 [Scenedesmus sp. NREL 46B-D3]|nr:hypothetical protein COO60DRAFT_1041526 [Scenedesmus sp. NREL 46B-D3]
MLASALAAAATAQLQRAAAPQLVLVLWLGLRCMQSVCCWASHMMRRPGASSLFVKRGPRLSSRCSQPGESHAGICVQPPGRQVGDEARHWQQVKLKRCKACSSEEAQACVPGAVGACAAGGVQPRAAPHGDVAGPAWPCLASHGCRAAPDRAAAGELLLWAGQDQPHRRQRCSSGQRCGCHGCCRREHAGTRRCWQDVAEAALGQLGQAGCCCRHCCNGCWFGDRGGLGCCRRASCRRAVSAGTWQQSSACWPGCSAARDTSCCGCCCWW